ncbi:transposase [Streptomyces sp. NPDC058394]|uniref:transposase n=1 Tax=Streptomyces sp. NPDC058394 TaxID=3346477 RepID=UPI00364DB430
MTPASSRRAPPRPGWASSTPAPRGRSTTARSACSPPTPPARGRALVDRELYLPKAWTSDRERCRAAKIPDERGFATKGELAREIVRRCLAAGLPAAWVTADEAYGQDWNFRRLLEQLGLGYVVAVPKSQQIKCLAGGGVTQTVTRAFGLK